MRKIIGDENRMWKLIRKTDTCWYWLGAPRYDGYGLFTVWNGDKYLNKYAHRFVYETLKGEIPKDKEIDHVCRNRICVNPEHLEVVSHIENLARAKTAITTINKNKTHCIHGHKFTLENTYIHPKKGSRLCKECQYNRVKEYVKRKRSLSYA